MTPCRLLWLALILCKLSRSFFSRADQIIVQVKSNPALFVVSDNSGPSPLTTPACFINVITVTYSWNFFCSEVMSSLQNKAWVCLWVSTVHRRDSAWMALNKFGSFFPVLSSRLSQQALHVHSCSYATPQGIQGIPSVACHKTALQWTPEAS